MRFAVSVLMFVLLAVAALLSVGGVTAKTYITLTPNSGPTGSTLQVAGFGFADGDVRIALAQLDSVESGFVDELPEESMLTLTLLATVKGEVERVDVTLPGASDFAWGKQVDILVIQEDPPTSDARFFVAKATFNLTGFRELPSAGVGPAGGHPENTFWPIAALATAGALLSLAGFRLRSGLG